MRGSVVVGVEGLECAGWLSPKGVRSGPWRRKGRCGAEELGGAEEVEGSARAGGGGCRLALMPLLPAAGSGRGRGWGWDRGWAWGRAPLERSGCPQGAKNPPTGKRRHAPRGLGLQHLRGSAGMPLGF